MYAIISKMYCLTVLLSTIINDIKKKKVTWIVNYTNMVCTPK